MPASNNEYRPRARLCSPEPLPPVGPICAPIGACEPDSTSVTTRTFRWIARSGGKDFEGVPVGRGSVGKAADDSAGDSAAGKTADDATPTSTADNTGGGGAGATDTTAGNGGAIGSGGGGTGGGSGSSQSAIPDYYRDAYDPIPDATRNHILTTMPTCVYCEIRPSTTIDHVVSQKTDWIRGGWSDSQFRRSLRINHVDNLVGACVPCNSSKQDKILLDEWLPKLFYEQF
jgi:hypothetical protein